MRILLVTPMVPQPDGAGAIPVLLHAELTGLSARHDVTLVTAIGDEPGEAQAAQALIEAGADAHFANRRQPRGLVPRWRRRWQLASGWVRGPYPWRTLWFGVPDVQLVLDRLSSERTFDVVAVEDNSMAFFRFPPEVPAVLTEHEVRRPRATRRPPLSPARWPRWLVDEIEWRRFARSQAAAWRRFDAIQVFTGRDAGAIGELAPEVAGRVRVNPFGIELPPPPDPRREEPGCVLFVGNFFHFPNRDAACWLAREILPRVREHHPDARLLIVGSGAGADVRELAGPSVEVIADAQRVEPYFDRAAVIAAPVRSGGGMRMKVLYALASGKPVVTTSRGAEGYDGLGEDAPLVVADDAAGLARELAELLGDEPRRRELGGRARRFAEQHHSPAAWSRRLEVVYEELRACAC